MTTRNLALTVAYDGTDFAGWQTQPGQRTVQETLEGAIQAFTREERIRLNASGRTDAGVHAVGQVANFMTGALYPPELFVKAVQPRLPADIVLKGCREVGQAFCANRDAKRKMYRYVINDSPYPDPFLRRLASHHRTRLDAAAMQRASRCLVGRHDFHSFETEWPNRMTSVRTITRLHVSRAGEVVWIDVEADGFLYNMVRAIAGTLMYVGRGYWPEDKVEQVLRAEDRREAGPTAPPQGLYLMRVTYE